MALARWAPVREMAQFRDEMDRMLERFFRPSQEQAAGGQWVPSVDIYDREGNLVVEASIPGAKKDDVQVALEDHSLVLRGEVKHEQETKEQDYYRHEVSCGRFERHIPLPSDVRADQIKARFDNGILRVTLPKVEEQVRGQRIEVEG